MASVLSTTTVHKHFWNCFTLQKPPGTSSSSRGETIFFVDTSDGCLLQANRLTELWLLGDPQYSFEGHSDSDEADKAKQGG